MEFKQSPNFTKGNGTFKPIGFIIHGTLGNYAGAVEWLCMPPEARVPVSYSSAHIVIAKDGRCTQLVSNSDIAWHAGTVSNPTEYAKKFLRSEGGKYVNPNSYFIGIENEWFQGEKVTEQQIDAMAKYIISTGVKNPVILLHSEITDYKADFKASGVHDTSIRDILVKRIASLSAPMEVTQSTPVAPKDNSAGKQLIRQKLAEISNIIDTL